jgi:hypothetical protein
VSGDVTVRTLRLRLPAQSAVEAEAFARTALAHAVERLPESGPARHVGALAVRVPAARGADPAGLGARLAEGLE